MSLKNSGGRGVNSLNGLNNNIALVGGTGSTVVELPGNKLQISADQENATLNDVLTNGNTSSLSLVLSKASATTTLSPTGLEIGTSNIGEGPDGILLQSGKTFRSDVLASSDLSQSGTVRLKSNLTIDPSLSLTVDVVNSPAGRAGLTINTANNTISSTNNVSISGSDITAVSTNASITATSNASINATNNASINGGVVSFQGGNSSMTMTESSIGMTSNYTQILPTGPGLVATLSCGKIITDQIQSTSPGPLTLSTSNLILPQVVTAGGTKISTNNLTLQPPTGSTVVLDIQGGPGGSTVKVDNILPSISNRVTISETETGTLRVERVEARDDLKGLEVRGGTRGITLNSSLLAVPQRMEISCPTGIGFQGVIDSIQPGSTPSTGTLTMATGATIEVNNIRAPGDLGVVKITATDGLVTGPLVSNTISSNSLQTGSIISSGSCVAKNIIAENTQTDIATITNLTCS